MNTENQLCEEAIYHEVFTNMKSGAIIYEAVNFGEFFIIKDINYKACEIIKIEKAKVIGRDIRKVFPKIIESALFNTLMKVFETGNPVNLSSSYYEDERLNLWKSNYLYKLSTTLIISIFENIDELIKIKDNLKRYSALFENSKDIILFINEKGKIIDANPSAIKAYGYSKEELLTKYIEQLRAEETMHLVKDQMGKAYKMGLTFETMHKCKGGNTFPVDVSSIGIEISGEKVYCSIIRNISERKNAEAKFRAEEIRYKNLFNNANDLVYTRTIYGKMTSCNKACEKALGYSQKELLNMTIYQLVHPDFHEIINMPVYASKHDNSIINLEIKFITARHEEIILELSQTVLYKSGYPYEVQVIARDVTIRKEDEIAVQYLTYHDKLTSLYNRTYFEEEILKYTDSSKLPISIIMLDVNGLKLVNDAFGHFEGDKLLKAIGKILLDSCRENSIVARIGGDEFIVATSNITDELSRNLIEKIKEKCKAANVKPVNLSISLGYAIMNNETENIEDIISEAENRMYTNKMMESKSFRSSIIHSLQKTLHETTPETSNHCNRMKDISMEFANFIGLSSIDMDKLTLLALLHDVGKIAIPKIILDKSGPLTDEEWEVVKRHSQTGYNIAKSSQELGIIADALLYHHERYDGEGYPAGLKGEEIPLLSRIITIIDAFDVMLTERNYKKAINKNEAIKELKNNSGTQFDPILVNKFIEMIEK
ncbi:PAS domain S-box protein [Candidatus Clostridium stratigraminis]|uniref:PAS domain S-box protein n=1 Tax=Candidatus Clostridium stratigraminis TaxID=3381661 RepID=A0ABW8SZB1_9CLOT